MSSSKSREVRRTILLKAKLRSEDGWGDVTIANVSSRGLLLKCPFPPSRNSFIEIRHRGEVIVGRVAWSQGARCGVRTQDPINLEGLLGRGSITPQKAGERPITPAHQIQAKARQLPSAIGSSERFARVFNWGVMALVGMAGAVFVADAVGISLADPFDKASAALVIRDR